IAKFSLRKGDTSTGCKVLVHIETNHPCAIAFCVVKRNSRSYDLRRVVEAKASPVVFVVSCSTRRSWRNWYEPDGSPLRRTRVSHRLRPHFSGAGHVGSGSHHS